MSKSIRNAEASVGRTTLNLGPNHKNIKFKRSIYAIRDIQIGERFTKNNIQITRPGNTLHPKFFKSLIGKISKKNKIRNAY